VKLWFDEDLSPTLVQVANAHGIEATCNRDRNMLGTKDPELRAIVQNEGFVFATDNASDFRPMYERDEIHPGLLALPGSNGREAQQQLAAAGIEWIVQAAGDADQGYPPNGSHQGVQTAISTVLSARIAVPIDEATHVGQALVAAGVGVPRDQRGERSDACAAAARRPPTRATRLRSQGDARRAPADPGRTHAADGAPQSRRVAAAPRP
jgi:predicted nuclease of predicted toxin-antitoxin system